MPKVSQILFPLIVNYLGIPPIKLKCRMWSVNEIIAEYEDAIVRTRADQEAAIAAHAARIALVVAAPPVTGEAAADSHAESNHSPNLDDQLRWLESQKDGTERAITNFLDVVREWDLTSDDGQPVPLTPEALRELNMHQLYVHAYDKAVEKMRSGE